MTGARQETKRILCEPYSRMLTPQEGGRYTAEILEFPGCVAEGSTPEEAYLRLEQAAEAWLLSCLERGQPIPRPVTNYEASGRFALRLSRGLYARAAKMAAREGVSLNQYIACAVAEAVGASKVSEDG